MFEDPLEQLSRPNIRRLTSRISISIQKSLEFTHTEYLFITLSETGKYNCRYLQLKVVATEMQAFGLIIFNVLVETDPSTTVRVLAEGQNVYPSTVASYLKQMSKSKKPDRWVPHENQ